MSKASHAIGDPMHDGVPSDPTMCHNLAINPLMGGGYSGIPLPYLLSVCHEDKRGLGVHLAVQDVLRELLGRVDVEIVLDGILPFFEASCADSSYEIRAISDKVDEDFLALRRQAERILELSGGVDHAAKTGDAREKLQGRPHGSRQQQLPAVTIGTVHLRYTISGS